jgi:hypothetical protein
MYDTMQMMSDMPYQEAQINLYTNQIWCVLSYHYFATRFAAFGPLRNAVETLSS